jgi:hypothetical protein
VGLDKECTDAWAVLCYQQRMGLATACPLAPLKGIWPRQSGDVILLPVAIDRIGSSSGPIQTRECLGGLPTFYHLEAA